MEMDLKPVQWDLELTWLYSHDVLGQLERGAIFIFCSDPPLFNFCLDSYFLHISSSRLSSWSFLGTPSTLLITFLLPFFSSIILYDSYLPISRLLHLFVERTYPDWFSYFLTYNVWPLRWTCGHWITRAFLSQSHAKHWVAVLHIPKEYRKRRYSSAYGNDDLFFSVWT